MTRRYASIWFRHLLTDWHVRRHPDKKTAPTVFTRPYKGRECVVAANEIAERAGIRVGMILADARTLEPLVQNIEAQEDLAEKLLNALAGYCMRFTPDVSVVPPDSLTMDITGCAHLWGGEHKYLRQIVTTLRNFGYDARASIADTIGAAWANAHYGTDKAIVPPGRQKSAAAGLPIPALRIDDKHVAKFKRLGFFKVGQLYDMPRSTLNRRFGKEVSLRLDQCLGDQQEKLVYKNYHEPYVENLMTPESVATAEGIAAALTRLLNMLCQRLTAEHKGVRYLVFDGFRVDGRVETVEIGTNRPSSNPTHLFKLFIDKLDKVEPALGIEQFRLTASQIETMVPTQNSLVGGNDGIDNIEVQEMVDRLANRFDPRQIYCFVPQERHWPDNAVRPVSFAQLPSEASWRKNPLRPVSLLQQPEPIEVTAEVPDYPPVFFRHRNKLHRVRKADGPERIEREWWIAAGPPRDYFKLEDENGQRFWVFRDGQYNSEQPPRWYLHGYFA